jgi:hypothetical protein
MKRSFSHSFSFLCFFILVSVCIAGCKKKEFETKTKKVEPIESKENTNSQTALELLNSQPKTPLTIKGLNLGMLKDSARQAIWNLGFQSMRTNFDARVVGEYGIVTSDILTTNGGNLVLVYNSDNKLVHVEMWGSMADYLFNTADMDLRSFTQTFINEYNINGMEPFDRGNIAGWRYRDEENGIELVIYSGSLGGKRITFHSIPKAIDRKFN